jgi:hypothetical protein
MARPILETLAQLRRGALLPDFSDRMADLVKAVQMSGRGGSITLKLTVKPAGKGTVRNVVLEDEITVKAPAPDKEATIFFPTDDGSLVRNDPNQRELALSPVPDPLAGGAPVRVEEKTGEIHRV